MRKRPNRNRMEVDSKETRGRAKSSVLDLKHCLLLIYLTFVLFRLAISEILVGVPEN